jgi:hypothetical protein
LGIRIKFNENICVNRISLNDRKTNFRFKIFFKENFFFNFRSDAIYIYARKIHNKLNKNLCIEYDFVKDGFPKKYLNDIWDVVRKL